MNEKLKRVILIPFNILFKLNSKFSLELMIWLKHKKWPNLNEPKTYIEKLNWMKLHYRNDLMPRCADKYHARSYIEEHGYGKYLPKLLWHGKSPADIPWDELPTSFIIKVTSGSGGNIICRDKDAFDKVDAAKKLDTWMHQKYLPCYGEWIYDIIEPQIIIEELLSDGVNLVPVDYKCFCFNGLNGGDIGCIAIDLGRYVEHKRNIYDNEWNFLKDVNFNFPVDFENITPRPACYEKMCEIAKQLSKPFPHVRVDFFVIGDRFYIGELTFFNGAGFDRITPHEYDLQMGDWIVLPNEASRVGGKKK